jgi:GTP-binding protein HflX
MSLKENIPARRQRALGLAIQLPEQCDSEVVQSLEELAELLKTAGIEMVGSVVQKREKASRILYMGTGKIEEIAQVARQLDADLIVADDELTALQIKPLKKKLNCRCVTAHP